MDGDEFRDLTAKEDRGRASSSADGFAAAVGEPSETAGFLHFLDAEFEDHEAGRELTPYDWSTVKVSRGRFRGLWRSAYSPNALLLHWTMNSGMYSRVGIPEGWFGLAASLGAPGAHANGAELDPDHLVVTGAGAELETDFPAEGGSVLVLAVRHGNREAHINSGRTGLDSGRTGLERGIVSTVRTDMARGLTESALALLGIMRRRSDLGAPTPETAVSTLFSACADAMALEGSLDGHHEARCCTPSYATFAKAREVLVEMEKYDAAATAAATGRCPRAIQLAFAKHAQTTPGRYFASLKLQRARTALLTDDATTIGQVAEAHGFWDWSRFTQMYRKQFGETPSQTRARRSRPSVPVVRRSGLPAPAG